MTVKETIVELLQDVEAKGFWNYGTDCHTGEVGGHEMTPEDIADYLIDNGATFQKWIPVALGFMPEQEDIVYCIIKTGEPDILQWDEVENLWVGRQWTYKKNAVTHWMPLPNPPKEVSE